MFTTITTFFKTSGSLTTDIAVLFLVFIFFFVYALYFGKHRIISFLLAFYPAIFLYNQFPFIKSLTVLDGKLLLLNQVAIFLLFLIPLDIIIGKYIFSDSMGGGGHYFRIAGYALGGVIMVLLFSYTVISLDAVYNFSSQIDAVFTPHSKTFWWSLAPIGLLFFL